MELEHFPLVMLLSKDIQTLSIEFYSFFFFFFGSKVNLCTILPPLLPISLQAGVYDSGAW